MSRLCTQLLRNRFFVCLSFFLLCLVRSPNLLHEVRRRWTYSLVKLAISKETFGISAQHGGFYQMIQFEQIMFLDLRHPSTLRSLIIKPNIFHIRQSRHTRGKDCQKKSIRKLENTILIIRVFTNSPNKKSGNRLVMLLSLFVNKSQNKLLPDF